MHATSAPLSRVRCWPTDECLVPSNVPLAPVAVATALLMATAAIGTQLPLVQTTLSDQYEALTRYPGTEVADIVAGHWDSTQQRFGLYTDLHRHASGMSLRASEELPLSVAQLYGLSRLAEVEFTPDPPATIDADIRSDLRERVIASGTDERAGPYAIALTSTTETLVAVRSAEELLLVGEELMEGDRISDG